MFDKIYRQANDEIPLNSGLLQSLKAEAAKADAANANVSKPAQKPKRRSVYRYGFAAAAVAAVVISANVYTVYENNRQKAIELSQQKDQQPPDSAAAEAEPKAPAPEQTSPAPEPETDGTEQRAQTKPKTETVKTPKTSVTENKALTETPHIPEPETQQPEVTEKRDSQQQEMQQKVQEPEPDPETEPETAAEKPQTDVLPLMKSVIGEPTGDTAENNGGSGGAGSADENAEAADKSAVEASLAFAPTVGAAATYSSQQWTLSKYCESFGFDISKLNLPKDMKRVSDGTVYVYFDESGKPTNDITAALQYDDCGEKNVVISLVPDKNDITAQFCGDETKISDGVYVKDFKNGYITVYAVFSKIGYIADCSGLSMQQAQTLARSFVQK